MDTFIACRHAIETAQLGNLEFGREAVKRMRAPAINESLGRHLVALDVAMQENAALLRDTAQSREADAHLRVLQREAEAAQRGMNPPARRPPAGAGPGA